MRGQATPRCRWLLTAAILLAGVLLASGFHLPAPLSLQPLAARASKQGSCLQRPFSAQQTRGSVVFGGVWRCAVASLLASAGAAGPAGRESENEGIPAPGDAELADAARAMNDGRLHEARRCVACLIKTLTLPPSLCKRGGIGGNPRQGSPAISHRPEPHPPKRGSARVYLERLTYTHGLRRSPRTRETDRLRSLAAGWWRRRGRSTRRAG